MVVTDIDIVASSAITISEPSYDAENTFNPTVEPGPLVGGRLILTRSERKQTIPDSSIHGSTNAFSESSQQADWCSALFPRATGDAA
jgi:hypothetical protein